MDDAHYLIEYRFQGSLKYDIRSMINHLKKRFHLPSDKEFPHITLAGGFTTNNEKQLLKDFDSICSKTPLCKFTIDGFGYFVNETGVIFINIKPSENLKTFRWTVAQTISRYCKLREFDYKPGFKFHATLLMNLNDYDFSKIKEYIDTVTEPQYEQILIRVTILKNFRILCEYDFLQRRLLNRTEALSEREWTKTFHLLKEFFIGNHDPNVGSAPKKIIKQESWLSKIPFIGKLFSGR